MEALPFPDDSFDTVVSTLVLCTVTDQQRALSEIRRVLKPGGTLRFVEHMRADGRLGRFQDLVVPIWRRLGAGCHPNRRTAASVEAAGFAIVDAARQDWYQREPPDAEPRPETAGTGVPLDSSRRLLRAIEHGIRLADHRSPFQLAPCRRPVPTTRNGCADRAIRTPDQRTGSPS